MKIFNLKYWIGFIISLVFLSACDKDRNKRGWSYFPDMEKSQAYETWGENPYMPDGKMMTGPVEGTVAINEHAYNFEKTPEDELKAASIKNPYAGDFDIDKAEVLYDRFCIVCHGEKGDGNGYLFTSKKYPLQPANYSAERAMNKTDGQLFHNIRVGFGVMGAYGPQMTVEESWQLVNYIRHLQGKK